MVAENERQCKILFLKKLFFQNVLAFKDDFIDITTPAVLSTQITCDVMFEQYVIQ